MAVLLIAVGLVLFYAANWKKMAPGLKLAQIVGALVLIHGGSFQLLFGRRPLPLAGRGLLVLGMLAFGAAIGLVAQTYHISAHFSNGVLIWLLGVLALSAVMKDRIGGYLAAALALLWHSFEFGAFGNINPAFLGVLVLLGLLFYRLEDEAGLLVVALEALLWLNLANGRLLERAANGDAAVLVFLLQQVPRGVCLIALDRLRKPALFGLAGTVLGAVVFALVIFLINRSVAVVLGGRPEPRPYRHKLLDGLSMLFVFLLLYAASFRLWQQSSVFGADPVVLLLLGLFVAVGLGLYGFLWKRSPDRLLLGLSAVVFGSSLALLLLAGPSMPWELYSVASNLLLLVLQGLLLLHATRVNSVALANLVIAAFALQIVTRFFDIFWDLLSGSLLFIVTGVVIFTLGFLLERNRRRLVRHMREARS